MFDLTGRVAVVTGASRGLGRADCLALARAGADVAVTDILVESDPEVASVAEGLAGDVGRTLATEGVVLTERTADEIRDLGRRAVAYRMDVRDGREVRDVFARIARDLGPIDILVNNAATLFNIGPIEMHDEGLWQRDVDVNLTGAYTCTKAALPYMRVRHWGRVIFMSSVAGTLGAEWQASYAATKAGMIGLGRTVALEGARFGITANVLAPGIIATETFRRFNPEDELTARFLARSPFGAPGEPEDVAALIVYLCSPEARYVTGQVIHVAGGMDLLYCG